MLQDNSVVLKTNGDSVGDGFIYCPGAVNIFWSGRAMKKINLMQR